MAVGTYTKFVIYEDEFYGQLNETLTQDTEVFNAASANAIMLTSEATIGNFQKEAFFTAISSLISRRDITSTSSQTPDSLASDDVTRPKLARGFYVSNTLNSLKRIGAGPGEFSLRLGEQVAKGMQVDYLNTLLMCGVAAMGSQASVQVQHVSDGDDTLVVAYLIEGMQTFGDAAQDIVAWVMHSKPYFDLMGEQAANITDRLAGATIYEGTVGTLGLPVVVTDSSELIKSDGVTSGTDSYYTLGLTTAALAAIQDGQPTQSSGINRGNDNLEFEVQGEHDYLVGVKGYDYTDTGVNPADAALSTTGNWSNVMTSIKSTAGVRIETA